MAAMKSELLNQVDDRTKELSAKHEEIDDLKDVLEKKIKLLDRKLKSLEENQDKTNQEFRDEIEAIINANDPLKGTHELEKKIKMIDQKHKKDNQDMHDGFMDLIDQKILVVQKERAAKGDRLEREVQDLVKRVDVHDDDLVETTKILQALDRDRIQDGKTSEVLRQQHEILEERLDNMAEAIRELNSMMNRCVKQIVDHEDLNAIKEACLQDFNTLNQRISDVSDIVDQILQQTEKNEKEIEALKFLKAPRLNIARKDISSPLRSSMSHFLGSNFHNRRSESQEQINKIESIQKYADNDSMLKVEPINLRERESVLSNSRINKYLGESFDEPEVLNYKSNQDKVVAFKETNRNNLADKNKFESKVGSFNKMRKESPGEEIVIEDIELDDYQSSKQKNFDSQAKPVSSKLSECTFKADEIFNDRSEKESSNKKDGLNTIAKDKEKFSSKQLKQEPVEDKSSLTRKKEETRTIQNYYGDSTINLTNQNKKIEETKTLAPNKATSSNILVNQNQQLSAKGSVPSNRNPEYKVQLGPIGGDTLDEESSEEEYESEVSSEDDMYFNSSSAKNRIQAKEGESKIKRGIDTNSEWDEENSDSNNKYKNYNPGMKAAKNNKKDVKMMDDLDFDDI